MAAPRHFLLRLVRGGPLVPARMQWLDSEPGEPENKRDRWPVLLLVVDIAGEVVPPEELTERLHIARGHWKYPAPISAAEYRHRFALMRSVEHRIGHPLVTPRRRVDQRLVPLPNFDRENSHVG